MIGPSISRKYAAYFLLLLALVVGAILGGAGYPALQGTTRLQHDLQKFFESAEIARQEEALRATAVYLRGQLFNPLYNLNIEKLNKEINQVRAWLPVSTFMVSDPGGRILTDGTSENRHYGETLALPLPELAKKNTIIRSLPEGLVHVQLFFDGLPVLHVYVFYKKYLDLYPSF